MEQGPSLWICKSLEWVRATQHHQWSQLHPDIVLLLTQPWLCRGHAGHLVALVPVGRGRGSCQKRMEAAGDQDTPARWVPSTRGCRRPDAREQCELALPAGQRHGAGGGLSVSAPHQPLSGEAGPWPAGMMEQMMLLV